MNCQGILPSVCIKIGKREIHWNKSNGDNIDEKTCGLETPCAVPRR
jgi:hypothetical protein